MNISRVNALALVPILVALAHPPDVDWYSTRLGDDNQYAPDGRDLEGLNDRAGRLLAELDLREGDVVVDIGAGRGNWAARMADRVGDTGRIYAGEIEQNLVDGMKERFADVPQVKPYLCPTDGTDLPADSVDVAFFARVYHHLDDEGRVEYLRHLHDVVRPDGRLFVIDMHPEIPPNDYTHGIRPGSLIEDAHRGGWIVTRYELFPGTQYFFAIFVQEERAQ